MNISAALDTAAKKLQTAGVAEYRREAFSLLAFVLQCDLAFLIAHPEDQLAANQKMIFDACIRRRERREPFQYITGRQEFFGLDFAVAPGVLIPRPETELLVETAISKLKGLRQRSLLEIGVGSGCISVSILHHVREAACTGVDVSQAALDLAASNAKRHGVDDRLTLIQVDLFHGLSQTFDVIVSNPPYIPSVEIDGLQPEVGKFEPHLALDGGEDGLAIIEQIVAHAPRFLEPDGWLIMEIGFGQAENVKGLFNSELWTDVDILADLQGIPRTVVAMINRR